MRVLAVVVFGGLVIAACGSRPLAPSESEVEIIDGRVGEYNTEIVIPLPGRVAADLRARPRTKSVVSSSDTNMVADLDSAIYVVINNLSKRSTRTIYLSVDLASATASASINLEVGATVFQGFYRDSYGVVIYQSGRVVANIEKGRPYQVTLNMKPAAVAPAGISATWDTALAVAGEPVVIPPPSPPSPPSLTLRQTMASAYYVFEGRQRLFFFVILALSAAEDTVDLEALDFKVVGSLSRFEVDTLVVIEKLEGSADRLLLKLQGSSFFGAGTEGKLRLAMTIPDGSTRTMVIGGIIARTIGLDELVNQNIGFSITGVSVKYPAVVSTRLPIGQAVPLSFISENQPILLL
ncbi:MAG: hypothetical protein AAB642_03535 [Patescibacteria group bacterium]